MRDLDQLFNALAKSPFRQGFKLNNKDMAYLQQKGLPVVLSHADDFVSKRLAPAWIDNDGQQTPMRGHPAFVAQHATATCCRSCLEKWHKIEKGRVLTVEEQSYVRLVLQRWLSQYINISETQP